VIDFQGEQTNLYPWHPPPFCELKTNRIVLAVIGDGVSLDAGMNNNIPEDGQFVYLRKSTGTGLEMKPCNVGDLVTFSRDGQRGSVTARITKFDPFRPKKLQVQYITEEGILFGRKFWISKRGILSVRQASHKN
jgi:hypothetical protein